MSAAFSGKTDGLDSCQYITFSLGDEFFAIDIEKMVEILRVSPITPVPKSRSFIKGVVNLRGRITTIIDVRARLAVIPTEKNSQENRILIIDNGGRGVGILVDRVGNIIKLKREDVENVPVTVSPSKEKYLVGVGKTGGVLYSILNSDEIVSPD